MLFAHKVALQSLPLVRTVGRETRTQLSEDTYHLDTGVSVVLGSGKRPRTYNYARDQPVTFTDYDRNKHERRCHVNQKCRHLHLHTRNAKDLSIAEASAWLLPRKRKAY